VPVQSAKQAMKIIKQARNELGDCSDEESAKNQIIY
jgi:hypothetical protein